LANEQHLAWLLEGVEKWNARRQHDDFEPDLSEADLQAAFNESPLLDEYGWFDLSHVNLRQANLRRTNLQRGNFTKALFENSDMTDANLSNAMLYGANLFHTQVHSAVMHNVKLAGANLTGADMRGAKLEDSDFEGLDFRRVDLEHSSFANSNLSNSNLSGVSFSGVNFEETRFENADVTTLRPDTEAGRSTPNFTDLHLALGLTQAQVDQMFGDSGTILPEHLSRPDHWPDLGEDTQSQSSSDAGL